MSESIFADISIYSPVEPKPPFPRQVLFSSVTSFTCFASAIATCYFNILYNFDERTNSSEITTYRYYLAGVCFDLKMLSWAYFLPSIPFVGFLLRIAWLFLKRGSSTLALKMDFYNWGCKWLWFPQTTALRGCLHELLTELRCSSSKLFFFWGVLGIIFFLSISSYR